MLILAGGRGERFWPWSRSDRPKQLLPLAGGGKTLLAATLERALAVVPPGQVIVLTARALVAAIARDLPSGVRVLGEPVARNTAAAIGAIAHLVGPDHAFAVMPADHLIDDRAAFSADLARAFDIAEREPVLVTFGIPVTGPETNLGYLERGDPLGELPHHQRLVDQRFETAASKSLDHVRIIVTEARPDRSGPGSEEAQRVVGQLVGQVLLG